MAIGTVFTLFVVPVYYSLIAAQHKPVVMTGEFPVQTPQLATWRRTRRSGGRAVGRSGGPSLPCHPERSEGSSRRSSKTG